MNIRLKLFAACLLVAAQVSAGGGQQPVNENDLFGDPSSIVVESPKPAASSAQEGANAKTTRLSGEITSAFINTEVKFSSVSYLSTYILANLFLDARLKKGMKAIANLEASYLGSNKSTLVNIREFFFDFNVGQKVYFRTGKQILQWGRCYFWNPTDLLNVERKTFIQRIGYREGAYGVKIHAPSGTKYNVYGFIDTGNAQESRDVAAAGKFEFLLGNTEMAFAAWNKRGYNTVWGYDFSTRVKGVDVMGEAVAAGGDNRDRMKEDGGVLSLYRSGDWTYKAALSFGRSFEYRDISDRITVISEFYYNKSGYDSGIFSDNSIYAFKDGAPAAGTKRDFIFLNNLYELHYFSKYYAALFTTLRRFVITDLTLNVNYIRNFSDASGIVSCGVQYRDINDFSYSAILSIPSGDAGNEYTFSNNIYSLQAALGIVF